MQVDFEKHRGICIIIFYSFNSILSRLPRLLMVLMTNKGGYKAVSGGSATGGDRTVLRSVCRAADRGGSMAHVSHCAVGGPCLCLEWSLTAAPFSSALQESEFAIVVGREVVVTPDAELELRCPPSPASLSASATPTRQRGSVGLPRSI